MLETKSQRQALLHLPSLLRTTTCAVCGMNYHSYIAKDKVLHQKHHSIFLNGLPIQSTQPVLKTHIVTDHGKRLEFRVCAVDVSLSRTVKQVDALLKMVNEQLNAPPGSLAWRHKGQSGQGAAFLISHEGRAVGLCVSEVINDHDRQARWMVCSTQEVVPGQINRRVKVGISRIWVAPRFRRMGLARLLLNAVTKHLIYGVSLEKSEIAFSQPSSAGGKLAESFFSVTHKSGETLMPVYLE